jgi:hypothetical protein
VDLSSPPYRLLIFDSTYLARLVREQIVTWLEPARFIKIAIWLVKKSTELNRAKPSRHQAEPTRVFGLASSPSQTCNSKVKARTRDTNLYRFGP